MQLSKIFCSPGSVCGWSSHTSDRKKKWRSGSSSRMRAADCAYILVKQWDSCRHEEGFSYIFQQRCSTLPKKINMTIYRPKKSPLSASSTKGIWSAETLTVLSGDPHKEAGPSRLLLVCRLLCIRLPLAQNTLRYISPLLVHPVITSAFRSEKYPEQRNSTDKFGQIELDTPVYILNTKLAFFVMCKHS